MLKFTRHIYLPIIVICSLHGTVGEQRQAQSPSINRAYIDTTCAPCQDFWRFANGAWLDSVVIPASAPSISRDQLVADRNRIVIRELLDSLAYAPAGYARSAVDRNVGTFYRACMDSALTGEEELRPLQPELRRLGALRSRSEVSAAIGRLTRESLTAPFWFVVVADARDPTRNVGEIRGLFGTTMPSRQFYLRADSTGVRGRTAFIQLLTRVFTVLGDPAAAAETNARFVLDVESAIVRAAPQDSAGPNEQHSLSELKVLAPAFDWSAFADGLGRAQLPPIYIRTRIRSGLDSLAAQIPVEQWRAYLRWRYVNSAAPMLRKAAGTAGDDFALATTGRRGAPPRVVQCVNMTTQQIGDGVARAYVARAFSPADRAAAVALAEAVRAAFRERLTSLDWLAPSTRQRALAKLDAMRLWIGYPDQWSDQSGWTLRDGPASSLLLATRRHWMDQAIASIGRRADPSQWVEANPAFVDLSYYSSNNALLVTAAALQPPAFDARADLATNLANIGFGLGHELSHGFDSNGRLFNEIGARENWWAPDDSKEFSRRAELLVNQYSQFIVIDSTRLNGRRTLGENIADISGVSLAYLAFRHATVAEPDVRVDGFTREQRFFIALAQAKFRVAARPETLRLQAETDTHANDRWRLNGALASLAAFAAAFGCKEGDAMVFPAQVRGLLW